MNLCLIKQTLILCFLLAQSGCASSYSTISKKSHSQSIQINGDITNRELTEKLLAIFHLQRIAPCDSYNIRLNPELRRCFVDWWPGRISRIDHDTATIELGSFSVPFSNQAGHQARIRRVGYDFIEIEVKGEGPYFSELPNEKVSRLLADIIAENL